MAFCSCISHEVRSYDKRVEKKLIAFSSFCERLSSPPPVYLFPSTQGVEGKR